MEGFSLLWKVAKANKVALLARKAPQPFIDFWR